MSFAYISIELLFSSYVKLWNSLPQSYSTISSFKTAVNYFLFVSVFICFVLSWFLNNHNWDPAIQVLPVSALT